MPWPWLWIGLGVGVYAVVGAFVYALCKVSAAADRATEFMFNEREAA